MKNINALKTNEASKKIKCTIGILTFNSGKTLKRCLDSVKYFDEIIICDGGSSDDTLLIAKQYDCVIASQDKKFKYKNGTIRDFSGVRNQIINIATHQWLGFVDSDEYFTPALVEEVRETIASYVPAAYWIPRKYIFRDKIVECAVTYPSQQMRFFHRSVIKGFEKEVHERVGLKQGVPVKTLSNFILVPTEESINVLRRKQDRYIAIDVERSPDISLWRYFIILLINIKIITLYLYRLLRNAIFCCGEKLPLRYELNAILYHIKLMLAFRNKVKR